MATILIVDDSTTIRLTVSLVLSKNYTVYTAIHGQDALKKLREYPIDLMICDVQMPVMDGLELLRCLRADPQYRHLPVIMLTQTSNMEFHMMAEELGANVILFKPVSTWDLTATVNRFIHYNGYFPTPEPCTLPIDRNALLMRMADDEAMMEAFLSEALPVFCNEAEIILNTLAVAVTDQEIEQIKQQCHALMGSSATIGAICLTNSCFELEMAARSQDFDALPKHLAAIQKEFEHVKNYTYQIRIM